MKKLLIGVILIALFVFNFNANAQDKPQAKIGYEFSIVKELPVTSVKNQNRTSTCWSFSTISFLESELLRTGKGPADLSEMFIVSKSYFDKADKFVRTNGKINFAPGSSFADALYVWENYGIVPDSVMPGLEYGEELHVHNELDAALEGYIKAIEQNPNGKLSTAWRKGVQGILNAYLGNVPEKFSVNGKEYTPKTYAQELGINPKDYISITSYTHHPFYTEFALEIPDNWRWDKSHNVPIDELMQIFDYSIEKGYTVLWGSDMSEKGFTRKGIAVVPEKESDARTLSLEEIMPEKTITQDLRQVAFDNGQTTDDHGMHIFGIARDQKGTKYYMVKNSWGTTGEYKGIWYVSENFVKYKTMNIVVNKNAVPKEILKKLNIK
ncbi:MAG: aminopeptidase [Bacteroidales bacterium]|nr:aminopeptidase [Bacteroidales bacterium]